MMSRFRLAFLTLVGVALGACAESTAPGSMLEPGVPQRFSSTSGSDSTAASTTSETGDPVARDGGNMMGGGGR